MDKGLLTVITVCFNAENSIEKTLNSILNQTFSDFEYLIIDGKSKDGTLDVIEQYKQKFTDKGINLRVISEPDKGIYDAMNKGIKNARGKWIEFLNAGTDYIENDVLEKVVNVLEDCDGDIVHGDFLRVPVDGRVEVFNDTSDIDVMKNHMILSHESSFFRREMHKSYPYNTKINIVADYNSCLKMYLDGKKFVHIPVAIVRFYEDGFSSKNRVKTVKQAMWVRVYNGVLPNNWFTRLKINLGLYSCKEVIYYYLCPPFLTNAWEKMKKKK